MHADEYAADHQTCECTTWVSFEFDTQGNARGKRKQRKEKACMVKGS